MTPEALKALHANLAVLEPVDLGQHMSTWWRIFLFNPETGHIKMLVEQKNIIPYQGADVLARLLAGDITYAPGAMFFEYENTAGVPSVPTPARDEGIEYYLSSLPLDPDKDYVRAPLVVSPAISASGSDYAGNQVTFFAVTAGTSGVHGRAFDKANDSKVYGVALAATPQPTQYTQDLLFSRSYSGFSPVPKEVGYQIGGQYIIRFR
jgi:hypothetical protein